MSENIKQNKNNKNIENKEIEQKPIVLISDCIALNACRYNAQTISDKFVEKFRNYVKVINVCPEAAIGMGIPRKPINIFLNENKEKEIIQQETNINWTNKMNKFSSEFVQNIQNLDGAILKAKSPSCGLVDARIRNPKDGSVLERGSGLFAQKFVEAFPNSIYEDEKRLLNGLIRENFLIKLYLKFRFRTQTNNINELRTFHQNNKYLLMMIAPKIQKDLGNVISSNTKQTNFEELKNKYQNELNKINRVELSHGKTQNVLDHIFGYLKKKINEKEKQNYLELIKLYREHKIQLITIVKLLQTYALNFEIEYLENQTIFEPYPSELLMEVKVS